MNPPQPPFLADAVSNLLTAKERRNLFSGGDGASFEDAVVIDAVDPRVRLLAEFSYMDDWCGEAERDWNFREQRFEEHAGKPYDVHLISLSNAQVRTFYFDLTNLFAPPVTAGSFVTPTPQSKQIEAEMELLDDHSLQRLVAFEHSDYRPEALSLAVAELRRRRATAPSLLEYWRMYPSEEIAPDGFCAACRADTCAASLEKTLSIDYIGTRLCSSGPPCPVCGSVVCRKWFCILIPLAAVGPRHRTIMLNVLPVGHCIRRNLRAEPT